MNAAHRTAYWRSPRGLLALGLLVAGGLALGWSSVPQHARTFAYAYAVLAPTCVGLLCVGALYREAKPARWLVPLLLVGVMLNVTLRQHDPRFSVVGLVAGGVAIVASVSGHKRAAIAAALVCCAAISLTLLLGLAR